jgi:hypothetical protein
MADPTVVWPQIAGLRRFHHVVVVLFPDAFGIRRTWPAREEPAAAGVTAPY